MKRKKRHKGGPVQLEFDWDAAENRFRLRLISERYQRIRLIQPAPLITTGRCLNYIDEDARRTVLTFSTAAESLLNLQEQYARLQQTLQRFRARSQASEGTR